MKSCDFCRFFPIREKFCKHETKTADVQPFLSRALQLKHSFFINPWKDSMIFFVISPGAPAPIFLPPIFMTGVTSRLVLVSNASSAF